jgi:hypothetical protein
VLIDQLRKRFEEAGHRVSQRDDVDEHAMAWFLDTTVGTLGNRRTQKRSPPWYRLPCGIRYPLEPLIGWLRAQISEAA